MDFNNVLKTAVEKFYNLKAHSFCHYVVKENLVYYAHVIYLKSWCKRLKPICIFLLHRYTENVTVNTSVSKITSRQTKWEVNWRTGLTKSQLFTGFHMFSDSILLSLTRKLHLPDFEFIMNLGDWPLVDRARIKPPIPIFSWCKSNVTLDIILPTYELLMINSKLFWPMENELIYELTGMNWRKHLWRQWGGISIIKADVIMYAQEYNVMK